MQNVSLFSLLKMLLKQAALFYIERVAPIMGANHRL